MKQRVLVVEDDEAVARGLEEGLSSAGHRVEVVRTVAAAMVSLGAQPPGLVVLDLGLPDGDGFEVLDHVAGGVPVIVLSARGEVPVRVRALEEGAVDYMVKPFAFPELLARVRLRLGGARSPETCWRLGGLRVDLLDRRAELAGVRIDVPPREFDLLVCLLRARGRPVSREEIGRDVWQSPRRLSSLDNLIDVHVSRLRERLKGAAEAPVLRTVRGLGYVLEEGP